jgi:hypothetical protein
MDRSRATFNLARNRGVMIPARTLRTALTAIRLRVELAAKRTTGFAKMPTNLNSLTA